MVGALDEEELVGLNVQQLEYRSDYLRCWSCPICIPRCALLMLVILFYLSVCLHKQQGQLKIHELSHTDDTICM